ncbi:N/A [soil metagenome]
MPDSDGPWPRRDVLRSAAYAVVLVAGTWWLLGQWAGVLRPLLLAIFLAYTLLPFYSRIRRHGVPAPVVIVVLAGTVVLGFALITQMLSVSGRALAKELPTLQQRFAELTDMNLDPLRQRFPWLPKVNANMAPSEELTAFVSGLAISTGGGIIEGATAGLYLLFLLLGAEKLPDRVRKAYPGPDGDRILHVAGGINSAIVSYLRAKVISSLILASAAGVVLILFSVKFVAVWVILTFLCNFIPYVGSVVSYTLPVSYAVLQLPPWTAPLLLAILLLGVQIASATLVEPMLIGRAVGLSPLIILAALAIWGTVWGLPGMFLAVPLTVVLKIILENIEGTRPLAKMVEE